MGTPALAAHILDRLASSAGPEFELVAVVTRPDRPRGRGLALEPCEVAAVAARRGLPILKPEKIRAEEFLLQLKAFEPDLLVVAAYGRILPNTILETPRLMPLNVHASLLPRYRGAAPIEAAILGCDAVTGVTIMRITEQMDRGPILLQREIPIAADETQTTLKARLAELGAQAMLEALAMIVRGEIREQPQDDSKATYCRPVKKEDAIIDWQLDAAKIEAMTRAYDPWPIARTRLGGQELLIFRAEVEDRASAGEPPGTIVRLEPIPAVQCGTGRLGLLEIQAPGRKRMTAADFMRGRRIAKGQRLGQ
jgi:methionyl-tRNA formyltransferase